jgi:CDP-6-deoxy-D-xylo-4-hexulose-3-dehydrase
MTDIQAAVGVAQMPELPDLIAAPENNWQTLPDCLQDLTEFLSLPVAPPGSEPSWFGFLMTVRPDSPRNRQEIIRFLENRKIGTRLLFAGNILKQPAYKNITARHAGDLKTTYIALNESFWVGMYQGPTNEMVEFIIDSVHEAVLPR